jgi:hypothetical protein
MRAEEHLRIDRCSRCGRMTDRAELAAAEDMSGGIVARWICLRCLEESRIGAGALRAAEEALDEVARALRVKEG